MHLPTQIQVDSTGPENKGWLKYGTCAIISRGLFTSIFTVVYSQGMLILKTKNMFLTKSGFKSSLGYNGWCMVSKLIFEPYGWRLHNPAGSTTHALTHVLMDGQGTQGTKPTTNMTFAGWLVK